MRYTCFILCLWLIVDCTTSWCQSFKEKPLELTGKYSAEGDSLGEWLKYSPSGDTLVWINFNNSGLRHGAFKIQDSMLVYPRTLPSRRMKIEELKEWQTFTYKGYNHNGKLHGKQLVLDDSSRVVSVSEFYEGKLHGVFKQFHPDGHLYALQTYMNGLKHGDSVRFYENTDKKYMVSVYEKGELVRSENYRYEMSTDLDMLVMVSKYQYDEPEHVQDGEWLEYYSSGQLKHEHFYENGLANGEWRGWYENGQPRYLMVYKDNDVFFFEEYDMKGNVK